ncbi:Muskelin N-terminus-domain-containing protein [Infundibulicybe gibba]|nr:Muskelin N-terminus-domain-containing protein [Infundibulicybe gibba]
MSVESVPLVYTIAKCSAHSGRYSAENILIDNPMDQNSRWSGAYQGSATQWLLLRLETLSILKSITFGKYHKPHQCTMKEFKVLVGTSEEHLVEVLHANLKSDPIPETFALKHHDTAGVCFPTRYVKIVPLSSQTPNYHTSVWHVSMTGINNPTHVELVRSKHEEARETAALRHILKHLRQRRLLTPYHSILARSGLQIEHPLISELYESIVLQGAWAKAETLLGALSHAGLFDAYLHACQPHAAWQRLRGTNADADVPSPRGGHAMCIDPVNDQIYLFGGWDGQKNLDDFWVYNVKDDRWDVLSHGTAAQQNAPGARSCHKMVFDIKTGNIYVLGRLGDADAKPSTGVSPPVGGDSSPQGFCSEFYRYHTRGVDAGKWDFLSFDTASLGGPPLVFDHQMVMDSDAQMVYVFGGRVVDDELSTTKYSGLYSYNVRTSKWKLLQHPDTTGASQVIIPSRFGHSMILEPRSHTLFIFAGQREDKYLSDMYAYDLTTGVATELFSNFTTAGGPDACFTQRAVIDPELCEIYVFCGLTRAPQLAARTALPSEILNWVYRYHPRPGRWTQILPEADPTLAPEPVPRYAHQVVYNPRTRSVFMHGGNAGEVELQNGGDVPREEEGGRAKRLDDFWHMTLKRPAPEEVIRRATYIMRQQQFREMCEETSPVKALNFLQTEVSSVVDHGDPCETETFRALLTHLLAPAPTALPLKSPSPAPEHEDSPPRKRSRPNTPEEHWTSRLDGDEEDCAGTPRVTGAVRSVALRTLTEAPDAWERGATADDGEVGKLGSERYAQRNAVFEALLEFVADEEKQPPGNLLDMIDNGGIS